MDYLRRNFSLVRKWGRPDALSSSILSEIPVDILVYIMDYLPSESAVAFSLSCMHLHYVLGTQHFSRVASSTEDTIALLNLLALDLPNQVVCTACKRLHHMKNLQRYNSTTYGSGSVVNKYRSLRLPACVTLDRNSNTFSVTDLFGTTAFKMAVKRYHRQPECTELLKSMSSEAARIVYRHRQVRLFREECRVVQGRLMHRLQSVQVPRKRPTSMTTDVTCDLPSEMICTHVKFWKSVHTIGAGVKRCQECRTEYRIDVRTYDGHGDAMLFTRWKDLGYGPEGEVWAEHLIPSASSLFGAQFTSRLGSQASAALQAQPEAQPQDGDLYSDFGDGDDFKFDSLLTSANKKWLFQYQD